MTEESKQRLLKYLTGTIQVGEKTSNPINHYQITNNLNEYIITNLSNNFIFYDILSYDGFDGCVLYGNYYNSKESAYRGVLIILDSNFIPIANITQYNSGTLLSPFLRLQFDESGNMYGVDILSGTDRRRFIMLSNPLAVINGNYNLRLRTSYFLDNNSPLYNVTAISKVVGHPVYIMAGITSNMTQIITTLKIQVGDTNEWTNYTNNSQESSITQIYYEYDNDDDKFDVLGGIARGYSALRNVIYKCVASNNTITYTDYLLEEYYAVEKLAMKSFDEIYVITTNGNEFYFGKFSFNTYIFNVLDITPEGLTVQNTNIIYSNNIGVGVYVYEDNGNYYEVIVFVDRDNNVSKVTIELESYDNNTLPIYVNNAFNLYNIYIYNASLNTAEIYQIVYNSNNRYNGGAYEDYDSLYPVYVNLLDGNNNYIFSRNLYNKAVDDNTTISIVEVPNTLANDTPIATNNLISGSNTTIVNDNTSITKNIYESLFINFINRIYMRNNITNEESEEGASRLNTSATSLLDHNDACLSKFRINFSNSNSFVSDITQKEYNPTTKKATVSFMIYATSEIDSIDLMSKDTNTIYNTITELSDGSYISDLPIGKYYTITQNIEIGG